MNETVQATFETALAARIDAMLDACTRCGKCVEACPVTTPAGVTAPPREVIAGVIDILRLGEGPEVSRQWANSCVLSGECIKACDYGVNPRFLLAMTRARMAQTRDGQADRRRRGFENFRKMSRDVTYLSRMQLPDELLARLAQRTPEISNESATPADKPDFIFYTGCNVLKTPHIALLALDIMDALGIGYRVLGGPTHCCGVIQMRTGDAETSGRMAQNSLDKLAQSKSGQVISWCPSCHVQFTETTLPTVERLRGARPFEMTPFMRFLSERLDALRPFLRERVEMRVALHRHPGVPGAMEAAETILRAVPGLEIVELSQPAIGLMSNALAALPEYKRKLHRDELEAARDARIDALLAVYHADHRELCAHEREWPFRIMNVLEIVGQSMGLHRDDRYKKLKMMQDVDAILADCSDLVARYGLDAATSRDVVGTMLDDQPLPLMGAAMPDGRIVR